MWPGLSQMPHRLHSIGITSVALRQWSHTMHIKLLQASPTNKPYAHHLHTVKGLVTVHGWDKVRECCHRRAMQESRGSYITAESDFVSENLYSPPIRHCSFRNVLIIACSFVCTNSRTIETHGFYNTGVDGSTDGNRRPCRLRCTQIIGIETAPNDGA